MLRVPRNYWIQDWRIGRRRTTNLDIENIMHHELILVTTRRKIGELENKKYIENMHLLVLSNY